MQHLFVAAPGEDAFKDDVVAGVQYVSRTARATVDLPDPESPRMTIKTVFGEPVSTVRRYRGVDGVERRGRSGGRSACEDRQSGGSGRWYEHDCRMRTEPRASPAS
ncbi:hypothetical protein GCM10020216_010090 [Nonomuraea helvata]